jgi:hypothetical protein
LGNFWDLACLKSFGQNAPNFAQGLVQIPTKSRQRRETFPSKAVHPFCSEVARKPSCVCPRSSPYLYSASTLSLALEHRFKAPFNPFRPASSIHFSVNVGVHTDGGDSPTAPSHVPRARSATDRRLASCVAWMCITVNRIFYWFRIRRWPLNRICTYPLLETGVPEQDHAV